MPVEIPVEVAVLGAGTMGAGIAQLALEHGHRVHLIDLDPEATARARAGIADRLERKLVRRGLAGAELEATLAHMLGLLMVGREAVAAAGASVVIEAVSEMLEVKQRLFARLDRIAAVDTILATNTSALSIGAIAGSAAAHPERVVGLHFFNPAPVMPLVEVVAGAGTDPRIVERAAALVAGWDRTPIRCADRPGFVVNRVNRPFTIQALRELERGEATIVGMDAALRTEGFPLGPFELMDLVGIDVNLAAATGIWEGFDRADRFRPSPIQARLVAAGRLGRKTGEGFYRYDASGARLGTAPEFDSGIERGPDLSDSVVEGIRQAIFAEAVLALDERVAADSATIDLALRLGAGHPEGPFEWAAARGRLEPSPTIES